MSVDLFKEFKNWFSYNFPGMKLTPFQEETMRTIFDNDIPRTNAELRGRLVKLLPKKRSSP